MLYHPQCVEEIWDTWLYYESGVHYLFTLHKSSGAIWDGISLSTSKDGVHFQEVGVIIEKRADAEWLGTGSTLKVGGRYYLNFSESREGMQGIYFAESDDLIHWRVMDGNECHPDPRWYDVTPAGRWDCIWTVPLEEGGYVGYLTAVPLTDEPGRTGASIGKVISEDGIHWRAAPPPLFEWGDMPSIELFEVGAVEFFDGYYHMMMGLGEERLGNRQLWRGLNGQFGMYHFISDSPHGPFRPVEDRFRLLCSPGAMTYFSRFYPYPDGMLVCHHSCEQVNDQPQIFLSPLKRAFTDGQVMELGWWEGNEAMFGAPQFLDMAAAECAYSARGVSASAEGNAIQMTQNVGGMVLSFPQKFNPSVGAMLTFQCCVEPAPGRMGAMGVWLGHGGKRTAFLMETRGRTVIGDLEGGNFKGRNEIERGLRAGTRHTVRFLMRFSLTELYIDERLVQCYSLSDRLDGTMGFALESAHIEVSDVCLAPMIC